MFRRAISTASVIALSVVLSTGALANARPAGLEPLDAASWDAIRAAHLLSRAGFGGTPAEILRLGKMPFEQAVATIVSYERQPATPAFGPPPFDPDEPRMKRIVERYIQRNIADMWRALANQQKADLEQALELDVSKMGTEQPRKPVDPRQRRRQRQRDPRVRLNVEQQRAYIVAQAVRRSRGQAQRAHEGQIAGTLRTWWLTRMADTRRPLEEKMTLFWHGHFTSGYQEVRSGIAMAQQNALFRKHATGSFRQLVGAITRDAAMLRYLDGFRNVARKPNENFARELMELFTIGIGHYTEQDIKEAARAFTGWTLDRRKSGAVVFNRRNHDAGPKTFMGKTGNWNGDDIVRMILERPETARHIVTKLCRYFWTRTPDPAIVEALAETFRESDYQIKPVLHRLFRSKAFYEVGVGNRIKSPTELVVGTVRRLGLPAGAASWAAQRMGQMGQLLLQPPNVKGWDGGKAWINTSTMLSRYNFARDLMLQGQAMARRNARARAQRNKNRRRFAAPDLPLIRALAGFEDPARLVDHLTTHMLQRPIPAERKARLVERLTADGGFDPTSRAGKARIQQVIILITSMPEYQLC